MSKTDFTPEQRAALDAYWAAKSPNEERLAYQSMVALGLPAGYTPELPPPYFYDIEIDEFRKVTQKDIDDLMDAFQRYGRVISMLRDLVTPEGLRALKQTTYLDGSEWYLSIRAKAKVAA